MKSAFKWIVTGAFFVEVVGKSNLNEEGTKVFEGR
jgi:hypothetical protein